MCVRIQRVVEGHKNKFSSSCSFSRMIVWFDKGMEATSSFLFRLL